LSSGATIGITSANGIMTTGTASGNIRTTSGRIYSTGANYIYNGSATQITGSGLPKNVNSLSVAATSNLTLSRDTLIVADNITIGSGANLNIDELQLVTTKDFTNSGTMIIGSAEVNSNGSFIATGTLNQAGGSVTYNRQMPLEKWHNVSSPVNPTSTPAVSFYAWNEVAGAWNGTPASTIEIGKSYTLHTSGNTVAFTGTVVNGASVTATSPYKNGYINGRSNAFEYGLNNPGDIWASPRSWTNYGGGGWNLLGNPFTSAMDAATFVSVNSASFDPNYQALYIFDGTQYKYAAAEVPDYPESGFFGDKIQVGQGFFALALYNNIAFNFTSAMQVHNATVPMTKSGRAFSAAKPEKGGGMWPGLQLKVKYGEKEGHTTIVYNEKMSAGLDPGYDVGQFSAGPAVEIYTSLISGTNGVNFARQALPVEGCSDNIVPVGIDTEKGGEVTFSAFIVPLENHKFFLEDRKLGTFTDLETNTYTVIIPEKTYGAGRFFMHASADTPTNIGKEPVNSGLSNLRVYISFNQVIIEGVLSSRALAEVYDIQGHKIFETPLSEGTYNTFPMPSAIKGIYIVKVADGINVIVRKVVVL
jgi:hypothetical protein